MGSFNSTCGITGAPVRPNDKVRLMFVVGSSSNGIGSTTHIWDDYKILGGVALKCTYEDYNIFELQDEDDFLYSYIQSILKNEEFLEDDDDMSFEDLIEIVHEGGVKLKPNYNQTRPVNLFVMHEAVWQMFINEPCECFYWEEDGNVDYKLSKRSLQDFIRVATKKHNKPKKTLEEAIQEVITLLEGTEEVSSDIVEKIARMNLRSEEAMNDLNYDNGRIDWADKPTNPFKRMKYFSDKNKIYLDLDYAVQNSEEMSYVISKMSINNIKIYPIGTSGQEYDLSPCIKHHMDLAKTLSMVDKKDSEIFIEAYTKIKLSTIEEYKNTMPTKVDEIQEFIDSLKHQQKIRNVDVIDISKTLLDYPEYSILEYCLDYSNKNFDIKLYMKE